MQKLDEWRNKMEIMKKINKQSMENIEEKFKQVSTSYMMYQEKCWAMKEQQRKDQIRGDTRNILIEGTKIETKLNDARNTETIELLTKKYQLLNKQVKKRLSYDRTIQNNRRKKA